MFQQKARRYNKPSFATQAITRAVAYTPKADSKEPNSAREIERPGNFNVKRGEAKPAVNADPKNEVVGSRFRSFWAYVQSGKNVWKVFIFFLLVLAANKLLRR